MNIQLRNEIFEGAQEYWTGWNYKTTKDQWLDNAFSGEFDEFNGTELEHEKIYQNKIDNILYETELKNLMKKYPKMEWN